MLEMETTSRKWKRTAYCGLLRPEDIGKEVTLCGWVQRQRDMGNLVFIDLRDREGLVQVVFSLGRGELLEEAKKIRNEAVIGIRGLVKERGEKAVNPELPTGRIEVEAEDLKVFNLSRVPPFLITDPPQASEELRFKYRYLDLRRPSMQRHLKLRHEAALLVRNFLSRNGFYEIETPFLTKSTPEGARDYLVPSRIHKGRFYALPQSPQLFKQILMMAGFDRYFQVVRCFRDEDLRADRQPEFTQIDLEMSFIDREDIFRLIEALMVALFEVIGEKISLPFPCFSYSECLQKFGTDKPDLRSEMEILDLTGVGANLQAEVVKKNLASTGVLEGLIIRGGGSLSRSRLDKIQQKARDLGATGIIWIKKAEGFRSSPKMEEADCRLVWENVEAGEADLTLLLAGQRESTLKVLGEIRRDFVLEQAGAKREFRFAWVTDFPLFEWSDDEGKLVSMHHPFTSPHEEDLGFLEKEPLKVRAKAHDLVLNGYEIGGGSIRIHNTVLQKKIFQILGLNDKEAEEKFGFFLEALGYGTPPHGGIALGFDRIVMLLAGELSIREVIPFPKTTSALCLMTGSPSEVSESQLQELGLKTK